MITLIGDLHGKIRQYKDIVLKESKMGNKTISLGDNGFKEEWDHMEKWLFHKERRRDNIKPNDHVWLGGNHDYYPNKQYKHSLGDFGTWNNIFFVRGALSIDKHRRIEGIDYFSSEELTYSEGQECIDEYLKIKPDYVISHECPYVIKSNYFGYDNKNSTSNLLQHMFEEHKPKLWIFGHYHKSVQFDWNGTTFICLDELETYRLDI